MQKVIQRTATARREAQRKAFKLAKQQTFVKRKEDRKNRLEYDNVLNKYVKTARQDRHEDWLKGPLAPKRDSGLDTTVYGALDARLVNPPNVPKHERRKFILFAPGDRVCIIRGTERGRIGEISQVNADSQTVIVSGFNKSEVAVPEYAKISMGIKEDVVLQEMPIPFDDIRLVIALEVEGNTRDCLVRHAYGGPPYLDRGPHSKLPRYTRYISGEDVEIPWPRDDEPRAAKDGEFDTLRYQVDFPTWVPSLHKSPFPSSVLDELRGKYSRFRARHEPEFVEQKKLEDYKSEFLKSRTLLTPMGELMLKKKEDGEKLRESKLDADGNRIMDKETRDFIEQFMQGRAGNAEQTKNTATSFE